VLNELAERRDDSAELRPASSGALAILTRAARVIGNDEDHVDVRNPVNGIAKREAPRQVDGAVAAFPAHDRRYPTYHASVKDPPERTKRT
jgi:hypothetical protein